MNPNDHSIPAAIQCSLDASVGAEDPRHGLELAYAAWEASIRLAVLAAPPEDLTILADTGFSTWVACFEAPEVDVDLTGLPPLLGLPRDQRVCAFDLVDRVVAGRLRRLDHGDEESVSAALREALQRTWDAGVFDGAAAALARVPSALEPWLIQISSTTSAPSAGSTLLFSGWATTGAQFLDLASGVILTGSRLERRVPGLSARVGALLGVASTWAPVDDDVPYDIDGYDILGLLEEGGMGRVLLAQQRRTSRRFALKVARVMVGKTRAELIVRFEQEIEVLARCEHPGVARVVDSGLTADEPWYAMEFIDGPTLADLARTLTPTEGLSTALERARERHLRRAPALRRLHRSGRMAPRITAPPPWRDLASLLARVADALHHLHTSGIVHRDVSPANVLVEWSTMRPVLTVAARGIKSTCSPAKLVHPGGGVMGG
ncbi:Serine/threonine-protein kinase PknF [Planctomycetes bacterium Pla86]|uniref:Serine/threonine-protein kinase PknF n=1 Tax=Engelhardtia mirabilis TaxID=2528011 RepID=A0A518BT13_9BACT|nr:Serine/threonine-protein kinase PknF [Planctomycetes bacterium Pla133]QDV04441.1 Serine/threonine-protein kinase PknF [Planctomycetes bacterium Pla86]